MQFPKWEKPLRFFILGSRISFSSFFQSQFWLLGGEDRALSSSSVGHVRQVAARQIRSNSSDRPKEGGAPSMRGFGSRPLRTGGTARESPGRQPAPAPQLQAEFIPCALPEIISGIRGWHPLFGLIEDQGQPSRAQGSSESKNAIHLAPSPFLHHVSPRHRPGPAPAIGSSCEAPGRGPRPWCGEDFGEYLRTRPRAPRAWKWTPPWKPRCGGFGRNQVELNHAGDGSKPTIWSLPWFIMWSVFDQHQGGATTVHRPPSDPPPCPHRGMVRRAE